MNRSIWVIAVMGFVSVIIVVVAMLLSLTMFQQSPASNRVRLAQQVGGEFGFPAVAADVREILSRTVLLVAYESTLDSKFDAAVQRAEAEKVALFVEAKYDGDDRRNIQEIRVQRREIRGRGCWGRTLEVQHVLQNPRFQPTLKSDPRLAVPPPPPPVRR